jgi:hypothetical protein
MDPIAIFPILLGCLICYVMLCYVIKLILVLRNYEFIFKSIVSLSCSFSPNSPPSRDDLNP